MPPAPGSSFLFIHVMKTAGTSLTLSLLNNFAPQERYPREDAEDKVRAKTFPPALLEDLETHPDLRFFSVHMPAVVAEMIDVDPLVTFTLLRHPVERALSELYGRMRSMALPGYGVADYLDIPWVRYYAVNYQLRMFATTRAELDEFPGVVDRLIAQMWTTSDPRLVDHPDVRLLSSSDVDDAVARIDRLDVVGLTDRYDDMTAELQARFGLHVAPRKRLNVGDVEDVPDGLVDRLAEENEAEIAMYERAQRLVEARSAAIRPQ